MNITILGIESSCDDTSAAIFKNGEILSNCVANQEAHKQYGGIVPEVASRAHQINIIPVIDKAIKDAGIDKHKIDAIAFTRGPGLIGSLIVGVSFAKSFALSLDIPMIEVNHMQAHVLAHFAEDPKPKFSFSVSDCFWRAYTNCFSPGFFRYGAYWHDDRRCGWRSF